MASIRHSVSSSCRSVVEIKGPAGWTLPNPLDKETEKALGLVSLLRQVSTQCCISQCSRVFTPSRAPDYPKRAVSVGNNQHLNHWIWSCLFHKYDLVSYRECTSETQPYSVFVLLVNSKKCYKMEESNFCLAQILKLLELAIELQFCHPMRVFLRKI